MKNQNAKRPTKNNIIKTFYDETCDDPKIVEAITNTLDCIPFKTFSIPVYAYKHIVLENQKESTKVIQVGFVKGYNRDTKEFTIVIYTSFRDIILKTIENPIIMIDYGTYNDEFTKINRLIIN